MLREFETPVKDAIAAGGTVTDFEVTATTMIKRSTQLAALKSARAKEKPATKKSQARFDTIEAILEAEQHIPEKVICFAKIVNKKGEKQPDQKAEISNDEQTSWLDYSL
jgi:hypothetical protein